MKRVYVAGKYSGTNVLDVLRNIGRGERTCAELFELGFAPFSPWADRDHVLHNPYGEYSVDQFKAASMAWLRVSEAVLVISISEGVHAEIEAAEAIGIPVFYSTEDLCYWGLGSNA